LSYQKYEISAQVTKIEAWIICFVEEEIILYIF